MSPGWSLHQVNENQIMQKQVSPKNEEMAIGVALRVPCKTFHNLKASRSEYGGISFRDVALQILKLKRCEKVGRGHYVVHGTKRTSTHIGRSSTCARRHPACQLLLLTR